MSERVEQIRECNACDWVGWQSECIHPKHAESLQLCPECHETAFCIMPHHILDSEYRGMSDLDKLRTVFSQIGISYTYRQKTSGGSVYDYIFIGECRNIYDPDETFENGDLDKLLSVHKFIEFEDGKLASYFNA